MKQRIILLMLCILLLGGVLYWWLPKATALYQQITFAVTATAQQAVPSPAASTPTGEAQPTPTPPTTIMSGPSTESMIGLAVLCIGFLILVQVVYSLSRRSHRSRYGSAHLARGGELREFQASLFARLFRRRDSKPPESRLILGKIGIGRLISLSERQQESNILLTAPVGSGKSSRVIIPNLLRERGSRSLFISDVKGELLRVTGGTVSLYHKVYVFAPTRPAESHRYNPLTYVNSVEDAQDLAQCWISNTGQSKGDDFWSNIAKKLMVAVILHLKATEPYAPFSRVADLLCSTSYDDLKATLTGSSSEKAEKETKAFFEFMEKNERLIGGLMTDIGSRFQLLLGDDMRAVTSRCDMRFERMVEDPTAFYLSIPPSGVERCQPLLATLMMQMFTCFGREAEKRQGRLPHGIICYLDEFANLGYIPGFGGYISTARSSGVAMLLAIQSFSQLDERYGRAIKESILANTVNHLLLPGSGLEETQYYSQRLGLTTIATESRSATRQPYRGGPSMMPINSMSHGYTEGQSQRSLQTADELRTMKKGTLLFVNASSPAVMLRTIAYFKDRKLAKLANLPFELDLPRQNSMVSVDLESDGEETIPEVATLRAVEFLPPSFGILTGVQEEPTGLRRECEETTYTLAPEE